MKRLFLWAILVLCACTANVQDLGTPEPAPKPKVDACRVWPLDGTSCTDDDPFICSPFGNLRCVCGVDHKWVCLNATLGLVGEHALADPSPPCSGDVIYEGAASLCACNLADSLVCRPRGGRVTHAGAQTP